MARGGYAARNAAMKGTPQGAVGLPKVRLAAIQRHAKDAFSNNAARQDRGRRNLQRMNLSPAEHQHVQTYNPYAKMKPVSEQPLTHDHLKQINTGPAPILGYTQKQIAHPNRTGKQLTHFRNEHLRNQAQLDAMLDPLSHQNLSNFAENLTGYQQIRNIRHDPLGGSLALAGILPLGKVGRLADLGIEAARGETVGEHAARIAQAAEEAKGIRKAALSRKAVKLGRRASSPDEAHAILHTQAENATARATKAARKNPQFLEHLPGESRPETGGEVGLKVREAMRGSDRIYKKQKELQRIEGIKRAGALKGVQKKSQSVEEELAGARKALAGQKPRLPFNNFETLRPLMEDIRNHLNTLNMLPHDRNRLLHAVEAGIEGNVPAPNQRKLIESVFGREVSKLSPEAIKDRGFGTTLADVGNIPRAVESSFDLSGALRQNLAAALYNPRLAFGDYGSVLKSTFSQAEFNKFMAEKVYQNPYYHMALEDGVPVTKVGELNQGEEAFSSNMAEHLHELPGIRSVPGLRHAAKAVSMGIRASDRNYVALLNATRMRLYQSLVEQAAENGWRLDGPQGENLRKQIGDTVATLTGRGNLGKTLSAHRATFNALFFSPGLMKSRINLLNPVWYVHAEPFVRQQRLRTALRLYGTLSAVLFAAKMMGAKVGTDPTNADFGKIKIGNTRIDPAGGLTQYMRLIGQLSEGKITSSVTGKVEPLSNGPFKTSRGNVAQQFLRNKFSPIAGLTYDSLFGPGFGQKLNPKSIAGQMFVPLLIQDMWQIQHAKGPGGGTGMAAETFLPDLLGIGIQNYEPQTKKSGSGRASYSNSGGYSGGSGYSGSSGYSSGSGYG